MQDENARWRMERWRMKDGGLRLEDGGRMEDGRWRMEDGGAVLVNIWRSQAAGWKDGGWRIDVGRVSSFFWISSSRYLGHVEEHMQTDEASQMPGSKLREPKHTLLLLEFLGRRLGGVFWWVPGAECRTREVQKSNPRGGGGSSTRRGIPASFY